MVSAWSGTVQFGDPLLGAGREGSGNTGARTGDYNGRVALVAQGIERSPPERKAAGSNPAGGTIPLTRAAPGLTRLGRGSGWPFFFFATCVAKSGNLARKEPPRPRQERFYDLRRDDRIV